MRGADTVADSIVTPPTTTAEENRHTAGQRFTSLIWESTQALIAIFVIGTTLYIDGRVALMTDTISQVQSSALMQLNVMAALVTGFYFGRTNHQKVGGVGGETAGTR